MSEGYKILMALRCSYMLILLPPSEGKSSPESGELLNLTNLSFDTELCDVRTSLITNLIANAKCRPAHEIYSGVLYQALNWEGLPKSAQNRGKKSVVIISALFGALRLNDYIPSYKVKMKNSIWKEAVTRALDSLESDLVIDCRSSTYAGAWTPDPTRTVAIRVFKVDGRKRTVITHMSKKYRGELTRLLLLEPVPPATPAQLAKIASRAFECELVKADGNNPWKLDLLITL